eukprot:g70098.t1
MDKQAKVEMDKQLQLGTGRRGLRTGRGGTLLPHTSQQSLRKVTITNSSNSREYWRRETKLYRVLYASAPNQYSQMAMSLPMELVRHHTPPHSAKSHGSHDGDQPGLDIGMWKRD